MRLIGKQSWLFHNPIYVMGSGTAVGPREKEGPLRATYDVTYNDLHCEEDNWEKAEKRLMNDAIQASLQKAKLSKSDIDFMLAGDLLNQIVTSSYTARNIQIPFLGMFSACSTSMETLAIGAALVDGEFANRILAVVSSHNATAERQFRNPTEYGGQKPDSATFTVTGSGAAIIGKEKSPIRISSATIGRVMDFGIKNPYDMGAAMAPAAADTISTHFKDLGTNQIDYDLIVTGDLSGVGSPILKELLKEEGIDISQNHQDCGLMVYSPDQKVFAGGSGCACSAVVTYGHLFHLLKTGELKKILVVATGALLSPLMIHQKETIPGIAHAVVFEHVEGM